MGRPAYPVEAIWAGRPIAPPRGLGDHFLDVDRNPLHRIDECLSDQAFDAWIGEVVREVEEYLGKHAAFEAFLDGLD